MDDGGLTAGTLDLYGRVGGEGGVHQHVGVETSTDGWRKVEEERKGSGEMTERKRWDGGDGGVLKRRNMLTANTPQTGSFSRTVDPQKLRLLRHLDPRYNIYQVSCFYSRKWGLNGFF